MAEQSWKVSYRDFAGKSDGENPSQFVASIDALEGYSASLINDAVNADWKVPPKNVAPEEWLRLVKVKIGAQCDFFAFTFDDSSGTVAYAGHRPSKVRIVLYWFSVPPGRAQLPQNAIRECATDFLFRGDLEPLKRTRVQVKIEPWLKGTESEGGEDNLLGGNASTEQLKIAPMEAIAYGAAFKAGWQPTSTAQTDRVTIEIRQDFSVFFSIRVRLVTGEKETEVIKKRIPYEQLYPNLVRLFMQLREDASFTAFGFLESHEARMIGWHDGMALVSEGTTSRVMVPATGKKLWETAPSLKPVEYEILADQIIRRGQNDSLIDWMTGEATPSKTEEKSSKVNENNPKRLTTEPLVGGPELGDGVLVTVTKENRITLQNCASGDLLKTITWPTWILAFKIVPVEKPLLAILDLRNRVTFLSLSDLSVLKEHSFATKLLPKLWYSPKVPTNWQPPREKDEDDFESLVDGQESMSAVLCHDDEGFVYMLSPPD
ncbi:MAG: hypothetical protein O2857_17405 [Planctomycetota bacterium]|nr:hypothetical protein [Planctomycetota bacterium]